MLLRTQIILIFLVILFFSIGVVSLFHYRSAREARLQEVYNHMESISETKKLRMKGIISKRQEQIGMLQTREQLREYFWAYQQNQNEATLRELNRTLRITRDAAASFAELHLVSMQGMVLASSSSRHLGTDFSAREAFRHARSGERCLHEFFHDHQHILKIHLAGPLTWEGEDIGVIIVETKADDLLSIINNYTGLGETGETTLARLVDGKVVYLTPTRFLPSLDTLVVGHDPHRAMSLALAGVEQLQPAILDYRGETVVASPRYLSEINWGLTTKIDQREALAPISGFLQRTFLLALALIVAVAIAAHFFAQRLVRPIVSLGQATQEIANGNLEKRISYHSRNEVGQLASNFNQMADKLVDTNKMLENKLQDLDRINESLNRFAYVVSHDLKSPLNSISALIGYLKENLESHDDPDVQKMLQMAEAKARHMQNLIAGILQYSMSGIRAEEKEPVDLNQLLSEILSNLDVPSHIQVTVEKLPSIRLERVMILQVFQNLLGNAIKYMDKPQGQVLLGCQQEQDWLRFFVQDNGRGIEKRHYEKIFDIFNRTHELAGIDSSGLGLSIAKRIVESKGGRIWVESEWGVGSTFFFTVPREAAS